MEGLDLRNTLLIFVSPEDFISIRSGNRLKLDPENFHHIRTVLRQVHELPVNLSPGDGRVFRAILTADNKLVKADDSLYTFSRSKRVSLVNPGIKRKNLDLLIQKSTEVGVDAIHFITSQYQNHPVESIEKLRKTALSACMQSKNLFVPAMEKHTKGIAGFPFRDDVFYFWGDPDEKVGIDTLSDLDLEPYSEICFINGSEGGWSPTEAEFLKNRFRSVRLSDNVLRSETAALVALFYSKLLIRESQKSDS